MGAYGALRAKGCNPGLRISGCLKGTLSSLTGILKAERLWIRGLSGICGLRNFTDLWGQGGLAASVRDSGDSLNREVLNRYVCFDFAQPMT